MTPDIAAPKRNGLAVLWDLLVAPSDAFAELRVVPHWGWAFVVTCILGMIGSYLLVPAAQHVTQYTLAHSAQLATLTADQQANQKKVAVAIQGFSWLFFPIIVAFSVAFAALLFLIASAIGRGSATYMKCFALAANVAFLNFGIGYFLYGLVLAFRDPTSFSTTADLKGALPSLAWLVPGAGAKVVAFLTTFSVFQVWSIVLIALGLRAIAGVSAAVAWATPILIAVLGGAVAAAFAT